MPGSAVTVGVIVLLEVAARTLAPRVLPFASVHSTRWLTDVSIEVGDASAGDDVRGGEHVSAGAAGGGGPNPAHALVGPAAPGPGGDRRVGTAGRRACPADHAHVAGSHIAGGDRTAAANVGLHHRAKRPSHLATRAAWQRQRATAADAHRRAAKFADGSAAVELRAGAVDVDDAPRHVFALIEHAEPRRRW